MYVVILIPLRILIAFVTIMALVYNSGYVGVNDKSLPRPLAPMQSISLSIKRERERERERERVP